MATTVGNDLKQAPGAATPGPPADGTGHPEQARRGRHASAPSRRSTTWIVAAIALPRVATAFVTSALTERSAAVGTAGPSVRGPASGLLNWDAAHYLSIAQYGYRSILDSPFLPGQPLTAHALALVVGFPNAMIAVSWIAFVFAVWGIIDVASRLSTRRGAIAAAVLFAWNPVSIFLVSGYAESLYIALTVWSLRFCLERRWLLAALLAGAASSVVPQGAIAGVLVFVGILISEQGTRRFLKAIGYGVISEFGLIAYLIYSRLRFGNFIAFETTLSTYWHDRLTYPFHSIVFDIQNVLPNYNAHTMLTTGTVIVLDIIAPIAAVGVLVVALWKWTRDKAWTLPTLSYILGAALSVCFIDGWGDGEARFITALVTVWLVAAVILERILRRHVGWVVGIVIVSAAIAVYLDALYNDVYWII